MVIAGNETTTKLLGNALYWLWRNPDQRDLVRHDPALVPAWVEETLRYDPSSQVLARTLTEDVTLHGVTMREGDRVALLIGATNRDERVFPDADRFDLRRDTGASLSFGHGTHFCLGAALARLEGRVALEELRLTLPDYEIDTGGIVRVHSVNVRGFAVLPIEYPHRSSIRLLGRFGATCPEGGGARTGNEHKGHECDRCGTAEIHGTPLRSHREQGKAISGPGGWRE